MKAPCTQPLQGEAILGTNSRPMIAQLATPITDQVVTDAARRNLAKTSTPETLSYQDEVDSRYEMRGES